MKHIVLFDIDGTLLRARGIGENAFKKAFQDVFQMTPSWESINLNGRTDPDIIDEICHLMNGKPQTSRENERLQERFIAHFQTMITHHENFTLLPGIESLLTTLSRDKDIVLGIETGNLQPTAHMKLARGNIHSYFQTGGYGSDSRDRKEIVRIAIERIQAQSAFPTEFSVTVIGDSVNDILAAEANFARSIGVSTGGITFETFTAKCTPTLLLSDLSDTDSIVSFIKAS